MALRFFEDKLNQPNEQYVENVLGNRYKLWKNLESNIAMYGEISIEWKFFSQSSGWCKKILIKKSNRNILFAYPNEENITCVIIFGEKALNNMINYSLTHATIDLIRTAKKFVEGVSIKFEVVSELDLHELYKLIKMKIEN